jgi:hypothetical protein
MQIDSHFQINKLIKSGEYISALEAAISNDFHVLNTTSTNMQMTQIYLKIHRSLAPDAPQNDMLLSKIVEYADKTLEAHKKALARSDEEMNFKAPRVVAEAYYNIAIYHRAKCKLNGLSSEEVDHFKDISYHYSGKAMEVLDAAGELLKDKQNEALRNQNEEQISILKKEDIFLSNCRMKAAFAKLSPKHVLTVASERREKFGLYNKELFSGIDQNYFKNVFSAYIALHEYNAGRQTMGLALQVCKDHGQSDEDIKLYFKKKITNHIKRHGIEGINEGILAIDNDIDKSLAFDKKYPVTLREYPEESPSPIIKQGCNPIVKVCKYLNDLATSASDKISRLFS